MMSSAKKQPNGHYIYRPYITNNGVRIYPKHSKVFRLWIKH